MTFDLVIDKFTNSSYDITFPDDIIHSSDYKEVNILPTDNLMTLSHNYYGTIDLWYILFFFNQDKISSNNTLVVNTGEVDTFLKQLKSMLDNLDEVSYDDKNKLKNSLIKFYQEKKNMTIINSVKMVNLIIQNNGMPPSELEEFLDSCNREIWDSFIPLTIKIPNEPVVVAMNKFLRRSFNE